MGSSEQELILTQQASYARRRREEAAERAAMTVRYSASTATHEALQVGRGTRGLAHLSPEVARSMAEALL